MILRDPGPHLEQESISGLLGRLVEDGRDVARTEIELYKAIARDRVSRSTSGFAFIAVALLLAIAATVMVLIAIADALAPLIGHALGSLAAAVIGFAVAGILAKLAVSRLGAAFGKDS